jgi:undecaprenyldiphospho-muramoylpentapeptide beta-N-acetylglucosaminyltransferase
MPNGSLKALLVADGSGGHLIPALQVAETLANGGATIKVWYVRRPQTAALSGELAKRSSGSIDMDPIEVGPRLSAWQRLRQCGRLWRRAERCFDTFSPDVVVGFGGWVSAPVVMAACVRRTLAGLPRPIRSAGCRRIGAIVHEQNAVLGRANRWLSRWVDRVALSFRADAMPQRLRSSVTTGLPVRRQIGRANRVEAVARLRLDPGRFTVLVLGGSQGARSINTFMGAVAAQLTAQERQGWQFLHLAGIADAAAVGRAYQDAGASARVHPYLMEMDAAYAAADLVIGRAGASTIAELSRCGLPSILVPYPHAGAHQAANARLVEAAGGGVVLEEGPETAGRILAEVRRIHADEPARARMSEGVRQLGCADAAERLRDAIVEVAACPR